MSAALSFRNVALRRGGVPVLEVRSLELKQGLWVLAGGNGAGKSTLLMAVAGLLDLHCGEIGLPGGLRHRGRGPASASYRRLAAIAMQDPVMVTRRVRTEVGLGMALRHQSRTDREQHADRLLEELGCAHLADRSTRRLSFGERRLVALARTVATSAGLILLDETTSGLATDGVDAVARMVRKVAGQATVILAAHDPGLAARLGAGILRIDQGALVSVSSPEG